MIIIRHNTAMIPGGAQFQDPRIPAKKWTDQQFVETRISQVIKFRMANPEMYDRERDARYFYPPFVECEIGAYNYERLGRNPKYFMEVSDNYAMANAAKTLCECGGDLDPNFCKTCSDNRILGWICKKCGRTYNKRKT